MRTFSIKSVLWSMAASILILVSGAITAGHEIGPAASIPLYLLITMIVALRAGFGASIAVAICATFGLDFFFTDPRFTLSVTSGQDLFALVTFAGVSLLVSHLSHRIRSNSDKLHRAEEQQRALYELSRSALLIDWKTSVSTQVCALVHEKFRLLGVALWDEREESFAYAGDAASASQTLQASLRAVRNYDLPAKAETIRLLRFGVRPVGAVLFRGPLDPLIADAVATLIATHMERIKALKAEVLAESQVVSEQLRTTVLDGLAHAVKTPLTTIILSSSGLRELGALSDLQAELAQVIENQASYLASLTDKLLRTSKLESREALILPRPVEFRALFESAIAELRVEHDTDRVKASFPSETPMLDADPDLLRMALVQVLENGLKYSPDGSDLKVRLTADQDTLELSVHNEGTFIPVRERALIFERYFRSPSTQHGAPGTGIGLSVARRAIEAHGGCIRVQSDADTGTTFQISLPYSGETNAPRFRTHC